MLKYIIYNIFKFLFLLDFVVKKSNDPNFLISSLLLYKLLDQNLLNFSMKKKRILFYYTDK